MICSRCGKEFHKGGFLDVCEICFINGIPSKSKITFEVYGDFFQKDPVGYIDVGENITNRADLLLKVAREQYPKAVRLKRVS